MSAYQDLQARLEVECHTWLVTGVAGFIGSHLVEKLLELNQTVVGLDNFSTGHSHNLDAVHESVTDSQWQGFRFVEGDTCDPEVCKQVTRDTHYVLHQAALGSVPRSINDPVTTNASNVTGFVNMINAARENEVRRFVYAASSSTYGDSEALPKQEDNIGNPLSPYAVTKLVNELYADVFQRVYGLDSIGLRYFNVFGPRQDPNGAYAAVIPKWISAMRAGEKIDIYGDGETSRDFTFVDNVVQCNLLAACTDETDAVNNVYNVACHEANSLNQLYDALRSIFEEGGANHVEEPRYKDFRAGDVRHSLASIERATKLLGYTPEVFFRDGLARTVLAG